MAGKYTANEISNFRTSQHQRFYASSSVNVFFLQDEEKTEAISLFLFIVHHFLQELFSFVVVFLLSQEIQKEEKEAEEVRAGK